MIHTPINTRNSLQYIKKKECLTDKKGNTFCPNTHINIYLKYKIFGYRYYVTPKENIIILRNKKHLYETIFLINKEKYTLILTMQNYLIMKLLKFVVIFRNFYKLNTVLLVN